MQAASRLSLQAIVRGSSSRCLLGRSTIVDGVAAPLAPRSSLRPPLPSIRHKSASSFAANVDEPSATGDAGGVEVPVLNTKGKGSLSQEKHSASSSKLPPKEERHRSTWTDEENFEEVLKRTPNLPNASYDETVFNKGIADTAAKYRKIVDRRLALYERSDPGKPMSLSMLIIRHKTDLYLFYFGSGPRNVHGRFVQSKITKDAATGMLHRPGR